jgi:hypothetical protein
MSALKQVLREELDRLGSLQRKYEQELAGLPKGSLALKRIKEHDYYYRAYRDGKKVRFDYVGKADSPQLAELKKQIEKRRELEGKRKQIKKDLRELKRALNA